MENGGQDTPELREQERSRIGEHAWSRWRRAADRWRRYGLDGGVQQIDGGGKGDGKAWGE
eukprot:6181662-Pleurochrysis_carterae.AAC.3